jgi:NurA-like 5'-3' nuclease
MQPRITNVIKIAKSYVKIEPSRNDVAHKLTLKLIFKTLKISPLSSFGGVTRPKEETCHQVDL